MRAALYEAGQPDLILDDIDIAEPGPGRVRVRVHHCGICHSDLHRRCTAPTAPSPIGARARGGGRRRRGGGGRHHGSRPGDKVVLTPIAPCGRCYWCLRGEYGSCVNNAAVLDRHVPRRLDRRCRGTATPVFRGVGRRRLRRVRDRRPRPARSRCPTTRRSRSRASSAARCRPASARCSTPRRSSPARPCWCSALGGIGISIVQGARVAGAAQHHRQRPARRAARGGATDMGATDRDRSDARRRRSRAARDLTGVGVDYAFDACGRRRAWSQVGVEADAAPAARTVLVGAPADRRDSSSSTPLVLFGISARRSSWAASSAAATRCRDIPRMVALWRAGQPRPRGH